MKTLVPTIGLLIILASNAWAGGHWRFERTYVDGEDTKTADWSGNGNHGVLVNGPSLTAGRTGRGMQFVGASSQRVDTPVTLGSDFTVSVWVRIDALITSYFVNQFLSADPGRIIIGENGVDAYFHAGTSVGAPFAPTLGRWYHMVLTYDGTTYTSYLDGRLHGTLLNANAPPSLTVQIGGTDRSAGNRNSSSTIDDVIITPFAWTAEEVRAYYHSGEIPSRRAE